MTNINMCCHEHTKGIIHVKKFGAHDFWPISDEEKVILEFNKVWQPTSTSGLKFHRLAGKYVRFGQFVDLHTPHWKKFPLHKKEELWTALMVCMKTDVLNIKGNYLFPPSTTSHCQHVSMN
jgi:hypothetical protein